MDSKEVVVLGVRKLEFDAKDGDCKKIQGTKVHYMVEDSLKLQNKEKGHLPAECWFPGFEKFEEFNDNELPGKYKMDYGLRLDGGKIKLVIKDFSYIGNINLG
ncbi:hypothetical protein CN996_28280 [Bacillus cereus]|nr:hypothetical protein CN996_28280 [Bacillus cereus]